MFVDGLVLGILGFIDFLFIFLVVDNIIWSNYDFDYELIG